MPPPPTSSTHRPPAAADAVTRPGDDTPSVTRPMSPADILLPETRLGRYVVRKVLGRGGMGCVYAAWDEELHRTVAVKVMHAELAGEGEHRARFLREARAVAGLDHDNVVKVYDVGQADGVVFFAMPHLHGVSLARFMADKGPPPVPAAVRIAREVASGLAAAHAVGLLHRDVKPGNVFLEAPKGRAKLLDFGLVTPTGGGDGRLTEPGMVVGTPAYMSPEQARGLPLDPRSDLFSLGAVVYHLLAGRMPFTGPDSMAVLTALAVDTPPPVCGLNPNVPARLVRLLDRLLSKDPNGRPASADQVVAELRAIERELVGGATHAAVTVPEPEPEPAPESEEPTEVDRPARTKRRRRRVKARRQPVGLWVLVGALALALVFGGAAVALLWPKESAEPTNPATSPTTAATPTTTATPTTPREDDREANRPWRENGPEGPRWMGRGIDGHPRPLPNWWNPGAPLPPGFRDPGPPPRPPRD